MSLFVKLYVHGKCFFFKSRNLFPQWVGTWHSSSNIEDASIVQVAPGSVSAGSDGPTSVELPGASNPKFIWLGPVDQTKGNEKWSIKTKLPCLSLVRSVSGRDATWLGNMDLLQKFRFTHNHKSTQASGPVLPGGVMMGSLLAGDCEHGCVWVGTW